MVGIVGKDDELARVQAGPGGQANKEKRTYADVVKQSRDHADGVNANDHIGDIGVEKNKEGDDSVEVKSEKPEENKNELIQ
jgi:hypothetical protein